MCLILISIQTHAQFFDSIKTSLVHKPKLDLKIDSRHGFISANVARIMGIKVGLDFNKTFKIGAGYNLLFSDINKNISVLNHLNERERVSAEYDFQYLALYSEYVFYREDPWEISILVHVGGGFSRYKYTNSLGESQTTSSNMVILYEPYMTAQYKFLKYFGAGAGVGYRLAYSTDKFSRQQLNSPIYVFKLKIFFAELYEDFIKNRNSSE